MPDLRSGVRQSKRIKNVQENAAVLVPTPRRGTRRGNTSKAPVLNLPSDNPVNPASLYPMSRPAGRGRGGRHINQEKNAEIPGAGIGGRGRPVLDLRGKEIIAIPDVVAERTAEKLAVAEEEGNTSPLPERVLFF